MTLLHYKIRRIILTSPPSNAFLIPLVYKIIKLHYYIINLFSLTHENVVKIICHGLAINISSALGEGFLKIV